jgi:hypothetical protein
MYLILIFLLILTLAEILGFSVQLYWKISILMLTAVLLFLTPKSLKLNNNETFIPLSISKHFTERSSDSLDLFFKGEQIPLYIETQCK